MIKEIIKRTLLTPFDYLIMAYKTLNEKEYIIHLEQQGVDNADIKAIIKRLKEKKIWG